MGLEYHDALQQQQRRQGPRENNTHRSPLFGLNDALLSCLWLVDIVFNSSIEFGDLPGQRTSSTDAPTTLGTSNTILTMCVVCIVYLDYR